MRYGFVGLGNLGRHLAMSLVKAGYQVTVTDLDRHVASELLAAGARWADTPKGVAEASDAVATCLPSPKVSEAVLAGANGILEGLKPGGTWIEMSTNGEAEVLRGRPVRRQGRVDAGMPGHRRRSPRGSRPDHRDRRRRRGGVRQASTGA